MWRIKIDGLEPCPCGRMPRAYCDSEPLYFAICDCGDHTDAYSSVTELITAWNAGMRSGIKGAYRLRPQIDEGRCKKVVGRQDKTCAQCEHVRIREIGTADKLTKVVCDIDADKPATTLFHGCDKWHRRRLTVPEAIDTIVWYHKAFYCFGPYITLLEATEALENQGIEMPVARGLALEAMNKMRDSEYYGALLQPMTWAEKAAHEDIAGRGLLR